MKRFFHLKLRGQLLSIITLLLFFMVIIGFLGLRGVKVVQAKLDLVFSHNLPAIDNLIQSDRDLQQLLVAERSMIFTNVSDTEFASLLEEYSTNLEQSKNRFDTYRKIASSSEEAALIEKYDSLFTLWREVSARVVKECQGDTSGEKRMALDLTKGEAKSRFEEMREQIDLLTEYNLKKAALENEKAQQLYSNTTLLLIVVLGIAVLLGYVLGLRMTGAVATPIKNMAAVAEKLAQGDLQQRITISKDDEIGVLAQSLEKMTMSLRNIVSSIKETTETVASSSEELSVVSGQMLSGADEVVNQAVAVETTTEEISTQIIGMASAVEEMSSNTKDVSFSAEQMSHNMNSVSAAVEDIMHSIGVISHDVTEARKISNSATDLSVTASDTMEKLGESAQEIGKVTEVIKTIAAQTNLLAINATIEAASAGDAGKGFAVVANEIKELSTQSSTAANDISQRINDIQYRTGKAVAVIRDIAEIISDISNSVNGIALAVDKQNVSTEQIAHTVTDASKGAKSIASSIGEVAKGATDLSEVSGTIAAGSSEIITNVMGVKSVAEDSASGASQINSAASDLAQMSSRLKGLVGEFRL